MKTIYMTLAAVSALAIAAPLAAQPWNGNRSNIAQLQMHLDTGIRRGTITRREAMPLRASLNELIRTERYFSRDGFSGRERNTLRLRSASLHRQITIAERNGEGRFDRDRRADVDGDRRFDRDGNGGFDRDGRFDRDDEGDFVDNDRRDRRGDRFAGDVRVGQPFAARQVALPMEYRARFRDSDASYYSYDDERIYQIDRRTGVVIAMFDIER